MGHFRAGVASHSNQWLSAAGPFATAPKLNIPRILVVSVPNKMWQPPNVNFGVLAFGVCLRLWIVCASQDGIR